jgi:hypothetical protein
MNEDKQKQINLEVWDDFTGEYIKTDIVKKYPVTFVPVSLEAEKIEDKLKLVITFQYNERDWKLNLNKTNQNFIRSKGLMPKQIIGKQLVFDKIKVRNPSTNTQVDSFIITDII